MLDVKVTKMDHDFNEREISILEVLIMNLVATSNAFIVKEGVMLNPLEKSDGDIYYNQMSWQNSIPEEKAIELKETIEKRIVNAMKMCGIEAAVISFTENAYLYRS